MNRNRIIAGAVGAAAVISLAVPLVSQASTPPRQGVGVALLDIGAWGAPDYGRPDAYIGAQDDGLLADPIAPGASRAYTVEVQNAGQVTEKILVFTAKAAMPKGLWSPSMTGSDAATTWTHLSASTVTLAAGKSADVTVTVTVPAGSRAQTSYGVVWAENVPVQAKGSVTLASAAGVPEYISVG